MGSLRFNEYSDSPTVFVPPHHHTFGPLPNQTHEQPAQVARKLSPHRSQWKPSASRPVLFTNPSSKRSRDEADDEYLSPSASSNPAPRLQEEPVVYGEGMTLISPSTGRAITAESQTGTWFEENLEIERQASIKAAKSLAQAAQDRASRPKKSLRLDSLPIPSLPAFAKESEDAHLHPRSIDSPVPDAATHLLGVGWKLIGQEEGMQSAAKGWAKYIDNHYPSITNIQLLLKSEGHQAYLVRATPNVEEAEGTEGFFLFAEDLNEGRLVAKTWDTCVPYLQSSPIVFEGKEVLKAVRTPTISHCIPMEEMNLSQPAVTVPALEEETTTTSAQLTSDGTTYGGPAQEIDLNISAVPALATNECHSTVSAERLDGAMDID